MGKAADECQTYSCISDSVQFNTCMKKVRMRTNADDTTLLWFRIPRDDTALYI